MSQLSNTFQDPDIIAAGGNPNRTPFTKFAVANSVGTSAVDIWNQGGIKAWPTVGSVLQIASTSANDTAAGTGARAVLVEGIKADSPGQYSVISETVELAGTTPVQTATSFFRVNKVMVVSSGIYGATGTGANLGAITITETAGATVQGKIDIQRGVTENSHFSIPTRNKGNLSILLAQSPTNKTLIIDVYFRRFYDQVTSVAGSPNDDVQATEIIGTFIASGTQPLILAPTQKPFSFPEKSDVWLTARTDAGTTDANILLQYTIVDDPLR